MPEREPEQRSGWPSDDFARSLRAALRPEPLPPALVERIGADLDQRMTPGHVVRRAVLRFGGLAAAACLLVAVTLPWVSSRTAAPAGASIPLSDEEAATIVAAYGLYSWDSSVDYTLDEVDASLDGIEQALRGRAAVGGEPSDEGDGDWDDPPTQEDKATGQGEGPDAGQRLARLGATGQLG